MLKGLLVNIVENLESFVVLFFMMFYQIGAFVMLSGLLCYTFGPPVKKCLTLDKVVPLMILFKANQLDYFRNS